MVQLAVILVLISKYLVQSQESIPKVLLKKQGLLGGATLVTEEGALFDSYVGIPYAKPPLKELRFKEPLPADPWKGMLNATNNYRVCPQFSLFKRDTVIGEEDCLYLNVYTPYKYVHSEKLLAVMVFIHGGGFAVGTGRLDIYGPKYFMNHNIVLVTLNYRLGPLGFLSTGDSVVPGNNGLKDQALAIEWVYNNIATFGGNQKGITLFGSSAGAAAVHLHMLSPNSGVLGYIQAVILQSGTALAPWATSPAEKVGNHTRNLAAGLNCTALITIQMVECLRDVDAYQLISLATTVKKGQPPELMPFRPVIEPDVPGALLTKDPSELIKLKHFSHISFLAGINNNEGAYMTTMLDIHDIFKKFRDDFQSFGPRYLLFEHTFHPSFLKQATIDIETFYFPDGEITEFGISWIYTDLQFLTGLNKAMEMHARVAEKAIYYYLFGYLGSVRTVSFCPLFGPIYNYDVCHCDELRYLFNNDIIYSHHKLSKKDQEVSDLMVTLWTNFAKYGDPTPTSKDTSNETLKWEPYTNQEKHYFFVKSKGDTRVFQYLLKKRSELWRSLFKESFIVTKEKEEL